MQRIDPGAVGRLLLADGCWHEVASVRRAAVELWPMIGADSAVAEVTFGDGRQVLLRDHAILGVEARAGAELLVDPEPSPTVVAPDVLGAMGIPTTFFSSTDGSTSDVRSGVRRVTSRP
jgi:hypothetical protein